jgi:rRNA maturation protein Nop10
MATITLPQQRIATKLSEIPDDQLACRAGRHMWPSDALQAGKPLPRGLTAVPHAQTRGVYQLRDTCQRCGKVRVMDTLPNGVYDVNAQYSYRDPKNWVKLDQSLDVYKRDLRAENFARAAGELFR